MSTNTNTVSEFLGRCVFDFDLIFDRKWVESERRGARREKGKGRRGEEGPQRSGCINVYIYNNNITNNLFINN